MELLYALPGAFLAILFALIERSFEIREVKEPDRKVYVETLYIAIVLSVIGTLGLTYLVLVTELLTVENLVTMFVATFGMLIIFTEIGLGEWVALKLLPNKKTTSTR